MASDQPWMVVYAQEIDHARQARASGNEGMARVCARRAAGIVTGEYLRLCGYSPPGTSAYESLKSLVDLPDLTPQVKEVANHFLISVDKNHHLPENIDLLADAEWLLSELVGIE